MAKIDKTYHKLLKTILKEGYVYEDPNRKGVNRIQINEHTLRHNFKDGFPALTTKKLAWKSVVGELLWILRGDTNIKYLVYNGIPIWNKDAYNYYIKTFKKKTPASYETWSDAVKNSNLKVGDVGRNYGAQLRNWQAYEPHPTVYGVYHIHVIDQLANLINTLRTNPMATKKIVTYWNPAELDDTALTPCHTRFSAIVRPLDLVERIKMCRFNLGATVTHDKCDFQGVPKYALTIQWNQDSVDTFLGLPFNTAFYGLLCHILAKLTNMIPEGIVGNLSNVHIYEPHLDAVKEQLKNSTKKYENCELDDFGGFKMDMREDIDQWLSSKDISDFKLVGYESYPRINAEMLAYSE